MKLDIYTDAGGCSTKKIRIGAVVVNQDDPNYEGHKFSKRHNIHSVKISFGFKPHEPFSSNSSLAELLSINEVLNEVSKLNTKIENINIYTDSMYAFNCCNGLQKKFKCELVRKITESIKSFKSKLNINVMWVKGHVGTWGNEMADELCKADQLEINEIRKVVNK